MEAIKTTARSPGSPVTRRKTFWLVAKHYHGQVEVLTAELAGDVKALPVFGFEEEADLFLWSGADQDTGSNDGTGWQVWQTDPAELASLLLGPYQSVDRVFLDPLPGAGAVSLNRLACLGRERFVDFLLDR